FEPDKSAFSLLELNVNSNKLSDVLLFRQILSNKEGLVKFYFNPENLSSASKSIISERNSKSIVFERLPSVKLSAYIKGKIDFLKMDIEGAEGLVMSELSKKHKLSFVREAVVEFHHHIDSWKDDFSDFLNIFEKNGFGYQIRSTPKMPFTKKQFQDILIYAYKK
ncbi:MAG: FkbM family methyltransferase, partial [uncultured bacterium]